MIQPGLFDIENRYESLSKFGDPLEKLKEVVNFEVFRSQLEKGLGFSDGSKGGRPPYDSCNRPSNPKPPEFPERID